MEDLNFRKGDAKTDVFGSDRMLQPSPVEKIPDGPTTSDFASPFLKFKKVSKNAKNPLDGWQNA